MSIALSGTVARIRFSNERFTIGCLELPGEHRPATFTCPALLTQGQQVTLHGDWTTHPRYGRQFTAQTMRLDLPVNADGLAHFLAVHPAAKGIGPVKGRQIAEAYGADFERVLCERPQEMAGRFRLDPAAVAGLREAWVTSQAANAVASDLAAYGLTYHQITTIVQALGPNAATLLREDPYRLVGAADGLGFARVDQVAQRLGIAKRHPGRLRSGLLHLVKEAVREGHCWTAEEELVRIGINLLALDDLDAGALLRAQLHALVACEQLVAQPIDERAAYALPHLAEWEAAVATWIASASERRPERAPEIDVLSRLPDELNQNQILAALHAFQDRATVITGGAGVGKTFTVASIVRVALELGWSVRLAAPTGKAAQRMAEQVTARGCSVEASTIHRLLGYHPVEGWQVHADNPLDVDLLIVDETSMIDAELAYRLTQAIDLEHTSVIFVGDPNQLPPVGAGAFLRDVLTAQALPITALTEVMRQAGVLRERSLAILDGQLQATARDGEDIPPERRTTWHVLSQFTDDAAIPPVLDQLWDTILPERFGLADDRRLAETQILTPTHKGPLGTVTLNRRIQELVHGREAIARARQAPHFRKRDPLLPGDKVVWTRNDYELDLFNGQIGIIGAATTVPDDGGKERPALVISFDGRQVTVPREKWDKLKLAFALTVHKAQGSEWPCVIVICHKAHAFQHHRGWLYTAATRASRCCILVGDRWGMRHCAQVERADQRRSFLATWLTHPSADHDHLTPAADLREAV